MSRYVRASDKIVADWDSDYPLILNHLTVDGPRYEDTGLIYPDGSIVYRLPIPIGFGRDDEW